jgi:hypothetical protein
MDRIEELALKVDEIAKIHALSLLCSRGFEGDEVADDIALGQY